MTLTAFEPILQIICPFGKHALKFWADVPSAYLRWILTEPDIGRDEQHTARHHLKLRGETP